MQLAVVLAALYSASRGSTGVSAFRLAPPRVRSPHAALRFGLSSPTATTAAAIDSRPAAVDVVGGVLHRSCSLLAAGGVSAGERTRMTGDRRHICELRAGTSEGEDVKADSSGPEEAGAGGGSKKVANLLAKFGPAGLVAYGVLNGMYYSAGVAYVMLGPMGVVTPKTVGIKGAIAATVKQLAKVIGLVWLGSQATKPLRLALSALLAPAADRLIASTQRRLRLEKKKDAVSLLVAAIFGSTMLFCGAIVLLAATRAAVTASTVTAATTPASASSVLLLLGLRRTGGSSSGLGLGFGDGGDSAGASPSSLLPVTGVRAPGDRAGGPAFHHRGGEKSGGGGGGGGRRRRAAGQVARRAVNTSVGDQQRGNHGQSDPAGPGLQQAVATAGDEQATTPEQKRLPASRSGATAAAASTAAMPPPPLRRRRDRTTLTPQQAADRNPPPQDNIHGWNEHPNHLLGLWEVGRAEPLRGPQDWWAPEAVAAAAPSVAAAAALAAAQAAGDLSSSSSITATSGTEAAPPTRPEEETSVTSPLPADATVVRSHDNDSNASAGKTGTLVSAGIEAGGFSYRQTAERDMIDYGSDVLHHVKYVVFRRGGVLKAGPSDIGVAPRSWRFNPGSRRILFEVDVPARGVTLRYTGKLKRLPGRFTRAKGIIRVRPMDLPGEALSSDGGEGGKQQQRQRQQPPVVPPSNRQWPKLAAFTMELDLPDKFRHKERRKSSTE